MSLIGCHGSVWTGTWDGEGLRKAIEGTAKAGYDLIEFPIFDPDHWDVELTKKLLADNGLAATASLGLTDDVDISSADPAVVAHGEEHLRKVIDILGALGATHLVGVIYSAMRKYFRPATPEEVRHSQEALGRLSEYAAAQGVTLGAEVVNRYETNIINTGKRALEFLAGVPGGRVRLHLDTYHMNIEESDMVAPVLDGAAQLTYVHIGESHRGYLGTGTVDFDNFFKALGRIGYDGPIVFESFSSVIVDPAMARSLAIWRNLWDDGADLAAHANAFIRGKIRAVETIALH
jgi:D-psicose/D-tagatose/L-ribulose 3-epimerase